jgi:hypothetical protein
VIGWHPFGRSFETLLQWSGANMKTAQELMRHSTPVITPRTYAQAVTSDKTRGPEQNRCDGYVIGRDGRHEETRTPDLYRVKVAL